MSLRCFSCLPCGPWLDSRTVFKVYVCVGVCICGANERVCVYTDPEATGQRVIKHRHDYSHGTHQHSHTVISSPLLIHFLFHTIPPYLLHSVKHIYNHTLTYSAHTAMHQLSAQRLTSPPGSFSSFRSFTPKPAFVTP